MNKYTSIHSKQIEKDFVKQSLDESLHGLSTIMLNGNQLSCKVSMDNTVAIVKKGSVASSSKGGGVIIFPSSFNINSRILLHRIKNYYYQHSSDIDGLRIGKYFEGFYYDFSFNEKYDQTSWGIELQGISSSDIESIAEELAIIFQQQSVILMDYQDGTMYLYNEMQQR